MKRSRACQAPQARAFEQQTAASVTKVQEVGGLVGRFLLAILAPVILSRRRLIRLFQVPGLFIMPVVFGVVQADDAQRAGRGGVKVGGRALDPT